MTARRIATTGPERPLAPIYAAHGFATFRTGVYLVGQRRYALVVINQVIAIRVAGAAPEGATLPIAQAQGLAAYLSLIHI